MSWAISPAKDEHLLWGTGSGKESLRCLCRYLVFRAGAQDRGDEDEEGIRFGGGKLGDDGDSSLRHISLQDTYQVR